MRRPRGILRRAGGAHDVHARARARVLIAAVVVAVLSAPALGVPAAPSFAASSNSSSLRASIDQLAQQWFQAQADLQQIEANIASHEQQLQQLGATERVLKIEATARAVDLYVSKPNQLGNVLDGSNALDTARRADFIQRANDKSDETFDALSALIVRLKAERDALYKQRDDRQTTLTQISVYRATLDHALERVRRAAVQAAARNAARQLRAAASSSASPHNSTRLVEATPVAPAPILVVPPPAPVDSGTYPEHNNPFLVCTRERESHGDYSVVDSAGLYYGAYQFSRDTWDVTALHAGRSDLVGVLPNTASPYDQDELAWTLYQWQGSAPWGGRC
jgi:hypothetical protein